MRDMFSLLPLTKTIGNWDVSNVTDMMVCLRCAPLTKTIGNWDVSNVTDMGDMFNYQTSIRLLVIGM